MLRRLRPLSSSRIAVAALACALAGCAAGKPERAPAEPWPRLLELDGSRVAFADEGAAKEGALPWLLVHGLGGSMEDYAALRALAAREHRVLALDLPGFGHSTNPRLDYRIPFYARVLQDFLARAGVDRVQLVCHSLGGQVCVAYAIEHATEVASLTLLDAAGTYDRAEYVRWSLKKNARLNIGKIDARLFPGSDLFTDERQPILARLTAGNPELLATIDSLRNNYRHRVENLSVPTLVIWGMDDPIFPVSNAAYLKENVPGAELHLVPGAGHTPMSSHPELVYRWIDEFHRRQTETTDRCPQSCARARGEP